MVLDTGNFSVSIDLFFPSLMLNVTRLPILSELSLVNFSNSALIFFISVSGILYFDNILLKFSPDLILCSIFILS